MGTVELGIRAAPGKNESLRSYFFKLSDLNFGIVLVGIFILFDFGAFQGVFEIVNTLRLPFILSAVSVLYAAYLAVTNIGEFSQETTRTFLLLVFYYLSYTLISTIDPERRTANFTELIQYTANYIIIVNCVKSPTQFILLIDIFLASILHSSFHSIVQGGKLYDSIWLRDENHISLIAAMGIPFAYVFLNEFSSMIKKTCYFLCVVLYIVIIVIAASRGGGLAMGIAMLLTMRLYRRQKIRKYFFAVIVIGLVFLFGAKFIYEMSTLKEGTQEQTASDRIYLWGIALKMFAEHPVVGVGPMNYTERFLEYDKVKLNPDHPEFKYITHSTPLQWLAETGIIGMFFLIYLQVSLYRNWKIVGTASIASKRKNVRKRDPPNPRAIPRPDHPIVGKLVHACAISQVAFWTGAFFLSLIGYPFYWFLIPLSESCKRIYRDASLPVTEENRGKILSSSKMTKSGGRYSLLDGKNRRNT